MKSLGVFLLLGSVLVSAQADVYRCEQNGKITFTDKPCAAGAEPARLPALNSVPSERNAPDLAKQFDADEKQQSETHAKADKAWLKKHAEDTQREAAIRTALIESRVAKGMTADQVRRVLNNPQSIQDESGFRERWIYQDGGRRRTITFKDGVVTSDTARSTRK